ncbi:hypothetical protein G6514_003402 [Epicoccum nigrum]|nr:hypothetical protein G6514_003402 [Epicoccum nigrum]
MASGAGVLWVSSKILSPSKLSESDFTAWYENDHAPSVLALPGVPSAIRYKALSPGETPHPHLITYELPSLAYTASAPFLAVLNQTPSPEEMENIYSNTAFDIRFYAELPAPAPPPVASPVGDPAAAFELASVELVPVEGREAEFLAWFAKGLAEGIGGAEGFVRLRRFEFVRGVVVEGGVAGETRGKGYLVLAKFEGGGEGRRGVVEGLVREGGVASAEVEWFGMTRVWSEGEGGAERVEEP